MAFSRETFLHHANLYRERVIGIQRFKWWFKLLLLSPTIIWFAEFNLSKNIPYNVRPEVDTTTLPYCDSRLLFGQTLLHFPRNVLEPHPSLVGLIYFFDLLSAFVYVIHFCFAWIFALAVYFYYRKRSDVHGKPFINPWTFLFCLGLLNLFSVTLQLCWPTAPPWYVELYGTKPPSYDMRGSPAGLLNADKILGINLFATIYGNSPIVFGSFPSLHGAWPIMITLFTPPELKYKIAGVIYVSCVWWAAMYLNHHFLTDLLGGLIIVIGCYFAGLFTVNLLLSYFKDRIYGRAVAKLVRYTPGPPNESGALGTPTNVELYVVEEEEEIVVASPRIPKMKKTLSRDNNDLDDATMKLLESNSNALNRFTREYEKTEKHL